MSSNFSSFLDLISDSTFSFDIFYSLFALVTVGLAIGFFLFFGVVTSLNRNVVDEYLARTSLVCFLLPQNFQRIVCGNMLSDRDVKIIAGQILVSRLLTVPVDSLNSRLISSL